MKGGTKSLSAMDLDRMESNPCVKANKIGKQLPYHLQYVKDRKTNIKPEGVKGK